ncbi:hypothetical protein [Pseudoalteromonas rubra]|nr:hypothetical protein [Pseudoalteromonas rubra]
MSMIFMDELSAKYNDSEQREYIYFAQGEISYFRERRPILHPPSFMDE